MKIWLTILSMVVSCLSQLQAQGQLFIIGGGQRPLPMMLRLVSVSQAAQGRVVVLPFASSEPDSSLFYAKKQFKELGCTNVQGFLAPASTTDEKTTQLDAIRTAALVYIPGGDQVRFMQTISATGIAEAIMECYKRGGTIAGTSAGAAVMGKKMITGVDLSKPEATESSEAQSFASIETNQIELSQGLGLLTKTIIDQHFIKRKRMNRLLAVALENPKNPCIGIDESTAIWIKDGYAEVIGESQVVEIKFQGLPKSTPNHKLSGKGIKITIYTEGDRFPILERVQKL